ncbi:MAG: prepilin-type N-terminal cleavage/methylation domain-containing protein [Kiritimatiellae bacterium]|nr:prepilin-type N-terminal cleavage/methylation domain-containing protein [Kiritimatiellia bacterium]
MRRGFTLIELLVVVAMIAVLIGAVGTGMKQARRRAQIARATQDVKEMTNAILAFENYARGRSLKNYATGSWKETTETSLSMILGGEESDSGEPVPVLYNAQIRNGQILDPWGRPYEFMIKRVGDITPPSSSSFQTAPSLPNFYRLIDEERE